MSELVKFKVIVNTVDKTVTFIDNGTFWGDLPEVVSKLTIYIRGENKDDYIVKEEITDLLTISEFLSNGVVYTYEELFGLDYPLDGFYLVEIIVNDETAEPMASDKMAMGFTYRVAEQIYNYIVGVHVPVTELFTSLTVGMLPQSLELLNILSTEAAYTYDRENKWRKIFNHINIVVNELDY